MSGIFDEITCSENLFKAWREFRRGKRGRADIQEFERHLEDNVFALSEELAADCYRPGPYRRFLVFDPTRRVIHRATVRDRLVHHAVHQVLLPVCERSFVHDSYSCRVGKGTHAAVRRLGDFARRVSRNWRGPCWTLKLDVRKFFDTVDHEILLRALGAKIGCQGTLALLGKIVGGYSSERSGRGGGSLLGPERKIGVPIGNLTSQPFANIYLDAFDHFVKEKLGVRYYIRYTDDMVILHQDATHLKSLVQPIAKWLWRERRLTLHPRKVEIRKLSQGIDFLGYVTLPHHRVIRTRTKKRMLRRINGGNLTSYLGVLEHCEGRSLSLAITAKAVARKSRHRGSTDDGH